MAITLLTLEEAAGRYGISVERLRRMISAGKLSVIPVSGRSFVDEAEVRRVTGKDGNHPRWMPLWEAARQYSLDEALLKLLVKEGKIRSGILDGEVQVAVGDIEEIAARLDRSNFRHLEGKPIEMVRAVEQYGFVLQTLISWIKQGHIRVLQSTRRPTLLNEADVAYARALADVRGLIRGRALFPDSQQYRPPWVRK